MLLSRAQEWNQIMNRPISYLRPLAATLALAAGQAASADIQWRSAAFLEDPVFVLAPLGAQLRAQLPQDEGKKRIVVSFSEPLTDGMRRDLADRGLEVLNYLGDRSYFATVTDQTDTVAIERDVRALRGVQEIQPDAKLDPNLIMRSIPEYAVVADTAVPTIAGYVVFHQDVSVDEQRDIMHGLGMTIRSHFRSINGVAAHGTADQLEALAWVDEVQWVELPIPTLSTSNVENRVNTQSDVANSAPYNLTGEGITAFIYDGGSILSSHRDFEGRATVIPQDTSGLSQHATHVAGTVGSGFSSPEPGMAPNVEIVSAGFEFDFTGTFLYSNPGDIEADYSVAFNQFGADISNNSIGTNTAPNGFDCSITGDYGVTSAVIDGLVRGSVTNGEPIRIVWANGNERQTTRCGSTYSTTAPPAGAKNHITVGATNADNNTITSFTSWGPVDDGRLKPDISGPGCQSGGDGGVTSLSDDGGYATLCGTSMAAPTVTGVAVLMLEHHRDLFPTISDPRNSTIKVLLAHNAEDLGNVGPDYQFGYGSVKAVDTVEFMSTRQYGEREVSQGESVNYTIPVAAGESEFQVTIAWDDAPATPNIANALVNNLDLVVISPSGQRFYPWTLNPASPGSPAVRTQVDSINNIEQVTVDNPEAGEWSVRVEGTSVPVGPQPFSIAADGPIDTFNVFGVNLVSTVPDLVEPGTELAVQAQVVAFGQSLVPGSVELNYRFASDDEFSTIAMTNTSGNDFVAILPMVNCDDVPEFFVTAQGSDAGLIQSPASGSYTFDVGVEDLIVLDAFETESGWVVNADGADTATTGAWNRMNPEATTAQPEDDTTDNGSIAWVTDGRAGGSQGEFDIDGGFTTLTSPVFELTGEDSSMVSYSRWYNNSTGAAPSADTFLIEVSNDNGASWTTLEEVGPVQESTGGWISVSYRIADFVALTDSVRFRFTASDLFDGSIVEAAIDDFRIDNVGCTSVDIPCPTDVDESGSVDIEDLLAVLRAFDVNADGDTDGDNDTDIEDLLAVLREFGNDC